MSDNIILKTFDTIYRIGVRTLYHSKWVFLFVMMLATICLVSISFFVSVRSFNTHVKVNKPGFYTIDVGQGDSLLYVTKEGQTLLIDTGKPRDNLTEKLQNILGRFSRKIDVLLLTHPDSDHVGEAVKILQTYNVGMVLYSPIYNYKADSIRAFDDLKKNSSNESTVCAPAFAGEVLSFGNEDQYFSSTQKLAPVEMFILSPACSGMETFISKKEIKEDNFFSVVSLIKNTNLIFTMADAPQKIEKVLHLDGIEKIFNTNLSPSGFSKIILKAGHHGSKTSSAQTFLEEIKPTDVVLSYGKNNRYGHPNQEVLDLLSSMPQTKIHRTVLGTVYFSE